LTLTVDEHEKVVATESDSIEMLTREFKEPVEEFAHVAGIESDEYFQSGVSECDHQRPPFCSDARNAAMNSVARATDD